jgi:enoyl-CoA hydratase/carnithine racemase
MSIVKWEKDETIAVLTMDNGPNLCNPVFFKAMMGALDEILEDESINGVVLGASDPKSWNTGIDLEWMGNAMAKGDMEAMQEFGETLFKLWDYFLLSPFPIVAAITGHAFANGAVIACACDFRFMREDRGYFCFPEIDVNVPFRPGIIDIAEKAVPKPLLQKMIYTGKRYNAREMEQHGVIEKACLNSEETLKEAIAFAKSFQKGRQIFYDNKKALNTVIVERVHKEFESQMKMFQK